MELGEDLGDFDAVMEIRLARRSLLPVMRPLAELEGARDEIRVESLEAGITEIELGKNRFERRSRQIRPVITVRLPAQPTTDAALLHVINATRGVPVPDFRGVERPVFAKPGHNPAAGFVKAPGRCSQSTGRTRCTKLL